MFVDTPAADWADAERCVWHRERGLGAERGQAPSQLVERGNQPGRVGDGVYAGGRRCRVHRAAADVDAQPDLALVAVRDTHPRGLADDAQGGRRGPSVENVEERRDARAAELLVGGEGEPQWPAQATPSPRLRRAEGRGDKGLHIARPAAMEPLADAGEPERIAVPVLALDGDHVCVRREQYARRARPPVRYRRTDSGRLAAHTTGSRRTRRRSAQAVRRRSRRASGLADRRPSASRRASRAPRRDQSRCRPRYGSQPAGSTG